MSLIGQESGAAQPCWTLLGAGSQSQTSVGTDSMEVDTNWWGDCKASLGLTLTGFASQAK